jgi:hypothetical protein
MGKLERNCSPSPKSTKFSERGLGGQDLPIDITRWVVMVRHRGRNTIDRWHGCRVVVNNDVKRARCQHDIVKNGKTWGRFAALVATALEWESVTIWAYQGRVA